MPWSFVMVRDSTPVAVFRNRITVSGTTAPVASRTVPLIEAFEICAYRAVVARNWHNATARTRRGFDGCMVEPSLRHDSVAVIVHRGDIRRKPPRLLPARL